MIKTFVVPEQKEGKPFSIEQYNIDRDDAMRRINEGEFTTLEQLQTEMQSW